MYKKFKFFYCSVCPDGSLLFHLNTFDCSIFPPKIRIIHLRYDINPS